MDLILVILLIAIFIKTRKFKPVSSAAIADRQKGQINLNKSLKINFSYNGTKDSQAFKKKHLRLKNHFFSEVTNQKHIGFI